jgi:YHS domain-containing protein
MNKKLIIVLGLFVGLLVIFSLNTGSSGTISEIMQVESKYVCMINNNLYDSVQIPVEVNELTYYGCCMGCKAKLENDPYSRVSIDPISGNQVDKATAIIGADSKKNVYYFESVENLNSYNGN